MQLPKTHKTIHIDNESRINLSYLGRANLDVLFSLIYKNHTYGGLNSCRGMIIDNLFEIIYGKDNPNLEDVSMCMGLSERNFNDLFPKIRDLVNQIENHMDLPKTSFKEIEVKNSHLIYLENNEQWFNNPFAISFYMFLIRGLSHYHVLGDKFNKTIKKYHAFASKLYPIIIDDNYNEDDDSYPKLVHYYNSEYDVLDFIDAYNFIKDFLRCGFKPFFHDSIEDNYPYDLYDKGITHDFGMGSIGSNGKGGGWYVENTEIFFKHIHRFSNKYPQLKLWMRKNKVRMNKKVTLP